MFGVKYFDIITFAIIPEPRRSRAEAGAGGTGTGKIRKGREKKTHTERLFWEPQSFITLDFQGLKFQPRCEEKLEPAAQLSTACQIRENLRRTRSSQPTLPPFTPPALASPTAR